MFPDSEDSSRGSSIEALLAERGWLLDLAHRLAHDDATAHDLAQDTLLATLRRRPASSATPRAFLATVLRRAASKLRRGDGRRRAREAWAATRETLPDTAALAAELDAQRAVVAAVLELPEPYRRTIMLRFFRNVTSAAIGAEEGVTAAAIDTRVHRALAMLRTRLDAKYGDRTAWCAPLLAAAGALASHEVVVAGTALTGGLVMSAVGKTAAAVATVAFVAVGWWRWSDRSPATPSSTPPLASVGSPTAASGGARSVRSDVDRANVEPTSDVRVDSGKARVVVVDSNDVPVSDARLIFEHESRIDVHRTDDAGCVYIDPIGAIANVTVITTSIAPQRFERAFPAGETRVRLDRGRVLSGVVRQGGVVPPIPLVVRFDYTSASVARWAASARQVTTDGFEVLETTTDGAGAFRFDGLPDDAHGDLRIIEQSVRLRADGEVQHVPAPQQGIELEVDALPRLRGRAIDRDGNGVAEAVVSVAYGPGTEATGSLTNQFTDEDGRFEEFLRIDEPDLGANPWYLEVDIAADGGWRRAARKVRIDAGETIDLGDVVLADPVDTPFHVVDETGRAIEGVVGYLREAHGAGSAPSDEKGNGVLRIGTATDRVYFAAVDREIIAVEVVQGQPVRVTMPLAAGLSVSMLRLDGTAPRLAYLEIESRGASPFAVPAGELPVSNYPGQPLAFAEPMSFGETDEVGYWRVRYEIQEGAAHLRRLRHGVPFDLRVIDAWEDEVALQKDIVLAPGEVRALEFSFPGAVHPLEVRVLDSERKPVAGATIQLVDDEGDLAATQYSNRSGLLRFDEVDRDKADLVVSAHGYPRTRVSIEGIAAAAGRPFEVVLGSSRRIELRVVDVGSRPLNGLHDLIASIREDGTSDETAVWSRGVGDGRYVFDDVPANGPIWFHATIGGRRYSLRHDSPAEEATLVVPEHGQLRVTHDFAFDTNYVPRLRLTPERAGEDFEIEFPDFAPRPGNHVFSHVLPGRYRITVISAADDEQGGDRLLASGDGFIEVIAGQEAKLALRRP